jgi:hypothetical protein
MSSPEFEAINFTFPDLFVLLLGVGQYLEQDFSAQEAASENFICF